MLFPRISFHEYYFKRDMFTSIFKQKWHCIVFIYIDYCNYARTPIWNNIGEKIANHRNYTRF